MKDGCTSCFCMGGYPMCASPGCALETCKPGIRHVKVQGICCPVCENSTICEMENGQKFVEGNRWQKDDCEVCSCTSTGIQCNNPVYDETKCLGGSFVKLSHKCPKVCLKGKIILQFKSECCFLNFVFAFGRYMTMKFFFLLSSVQQY